MDENDTRARNILSIGECMAWREIPQQHSNIRSFAPGRAVLCTGLDIAEEVFSFMEYLFASVPQWISSSHLPSKGTNH
jgi:hypothetical protein